MKLLALLAGAVAVIAGLIVWGRIGRAPEITTPSVLGQASPSSQTHFDNLIVPTSKTSTPDSVSLTATPTSFIAPLPAVAIIDGPKEMIEGGMATFTWHVGGVSASIRTTTIYYGTKSAPGVFDNYITPADAHYTNQLKDFLDGNYAVPLQFVGSIPLGIPGTYFYRAYALIDGNHYWSAERNFVVKALPRHEIKALHYPGVVAAGANAAFTWDIFGPAATTGFTAIVGGKQSRPGALDASVDIPQTPYAVITKDFISGTYDVPLRFVGNAKLTEPGVYYFRALAFINGKNIWSDEHSFTVE